jgi:hypothetical protein
MICLLPGAGTVAARVLVKVDLMANPGPDSRPLLAIGEPAEQAGKRPSSIRYYEQRLRDVADRKLPQIAALIERTELVRAWLESAGPGADGT